MRGTIFGCFCTVYCFMVNPRIQAIYLRRIKAAATAHREREKNLRLQEVRIEDLTDCAGLGSWLRLLVRVYAGACANRRWEGRGASMWDWNKWMVLVGLYLT